MKNLQETISNILYVSKLTKTNRKKIIIVASVILSNISALMDILLILAFTGLITSSDNYEGFTKTIIDLFIEYPFLLPVIVLVRFGCIYSQTIIEKALILNVQQNLKVHVLDEVFDKRNYSVADAYFYINDITGHISFFYTALIGLMNSLIQTFGFLAYLIISDARTIITFGVGALILFYPSRFFVNKSREYMDKAYKIQKKSNYEIQKIVDNMFLIKLLKKDREEIANFENVIVKLNNALLNNHRFGSINSFLPSFVTMFVFSVLIGFFNFARVLTLDFIGVTLRLFQSLGLITSSINRLVNSQVHIKYFYLMDKNKNKLNKENYITNNSSLDEIVVSIRDLSFSYFNSEEKIFENLNASFYKNKHTLITGPNGSGKSTLLGLMSGVLYSQKGNVSVNSGKIGYIGASPLIFSNSLRFNLQYGNEKELDDTTLLDELKQFNFFQDPKKYDLDMKIDNKSLSSGQMQKLSFIRALLSESNILLLDESTANLDDDTKDKIFEILDTKKITIINSTHDPKRFNNADYHYKISFDNDKRFLIEEKY